MAKCVRLQRKKTYVCTGSLRYTIQVYERDLEPPVNSLSMTPDYTETFTLLWTLKAMIETPKGKVIFDEVGTEKRVTHVFYTRYVPNITAQNWIEYDSVRYDIERVTNLEGNKLYLKIETIIRGAIDKEATEA